MGRAGFARISITPPLGVELAGYGVYLRCRASEVPPFSPAVGDTLVAGAVALIESLES